MVSFGDLFQIPPIPSSAALYVPDAAKSEMAAKAKSLFWGEGLDGLNMWRFILSPVVKFIFFKFVAF